LMNVMPVKAVCILNLDFLYVNSIQSFFAILNFKRHTVILTYFVDEACLVNKDVLICIISNDETETF
jgi:hypothetical protein